MIFGVRGSAAVPLVHVTHSIESLEVTRMWNDAQEVTSVLFEIYQCQIPTIGLVLRSNLSNLISSRILIAIRFILYTGVNDRKW
jgi:hypothetical protein